jgi:hypothetical protein
MKDGKGKDWIKKKAGKLILIATIAQNLIAGLEEFFLEADGAPEIPDLGPLQCDADPFYFQIFGNATLFFN